MKQNLIKEAIARAILKEAEKKSEDKHRKCNKLINKIKGDIDALSEEFESMGIDKTSRPYKQLEKMYDIMAGFDPVQKKLGDYFQMPTKQSADSMFSEDVKMPSDSDRDTEQRAVDMSKKYEMDIELKPDEDENM